MAGAWNADVDAPADATLIDVFRMSADKPVSGGWRSGGLRGRWSIRAFR
jgi:hypothetical protein